MHPYHPYMQKAISSRVSGKDSVTRYGSSVLFAPIIFFSLFWFGCHNDTPDGPGRPTAGPILFISDKSGTYQLFSMNDDGTDIQQLTDDAAFPLQDAKYSPDGTRVVVASSAGGDDFYGPALYVMNLDGSSRTRITRAQNEHPEYGSGCRPTWARIGERIAFSRLMAPEALGNYDLFVVNSDGSNEIEITYTADTTEYLGDWTSDGLGIVCAIWTLGGGSTLEYSRLALYDLIGTIKTTWFEPGHSSSSPITSPSGQEIAFTSSDGGGTQDIFVVRSDTTGARWKISDGKNVYTVPIFWSPDGKQVMYNAGGNDPYGRPFGKILLVNVQSKEVTDITPFKGTSAYSYATCRSRK